jgi:sulfopropanediol 3-dehydrogenase
MIRRLKASAPSEARAEADRKVRETVEQTLHAIETRGDEAVRELSEKFDRWSPATFRLSQAEIERAISELELSSVLVYGGQ